MYSRRTQRTSCAPSFKRAASRAIFLQFEGRPEKCGPGRRRAAARCAASWSRARPAPSVARRPPTADGRARRDRCPHALPKPPPGARTTHVDRRRGAGRVRGVLCFNCNSAIGKLGDDPDALRRAISYLEGNPWKPTLVAPGVYRLPS
nr:endonuclease domain-containing protein [Streptomyces sp. MNP-20]